MSTPTPEPEDDPLKLVDDLILSTANEDKPLLGEFLLEQIKISTKCHIAEKMLNKFIECKVTNQNQIITALLTMFFKYEGAGRAIESFVSYCDEAIKLAFLSQLDHMLMSQKDVQEFLMDNEIDTGKEKTSRDIKKLMNRLYKAAPRYDQPGDALHPYALATPNYLEMSNWDTCLYLLKVKFRQLKNSMSDEAWLELSQLLVRSTPAIYKRLVNTLRNISHDEAERWITRYQRPSNYQHAALQGNQFTYVPGANLGYLNPHENYRFYIGRPHKSLVIKFVDNVAEFAMMIDYLKDQSVLGLDGEWLPIFSFLPSRISILQISTATHCYLLDLLNFYQKPQQYRDLWRRFVSEIMESRTITKIGFGIHHDLENMRSATGMSCKLNNTIDLSKYTPYLITFFADQDLRALSIKRNDPALSFKRTFVHIVNRCREKEHRQQGLALLTYILFGKELDKSEQMSNWNRRPLRRAQLVYGALDAFCLVDIYEQLAMLNLHMFNFETVETLLYVMRTTPSTANSSTDVITTDVPAEGSSSSGGDGGGTSNRARNKNKRNRKKKKEKRDDEPQTVDYNPFE